MGIFESVIGAVAGPLVGGLFGSSNSNSGGGGGTQQVNNTTTSTSEPWREIQPYLIGAGGLYPEAQQVYRTNVGSYNPYSLAPVDDATKYGYGLALQNAMASGQLGEQYLNQVAGQFPALSNAMNFGLTGAMDVKNNPAVQEQINALNQYADAQRNALQTRTSQRGQDLVSDLTRQFNESTMPQLRSQAIGAGQLGSSRDALASTLAQTRNQESLTRQLGNLSQNMMDEDAKLQATQQGAVAQLLGNAYNTGANMWSQALNTVPRTIGAFTEMGQGLIGQAPTTLQNLGQYNQAYEQARLDQPTKRLQTFGNIVSGGGNMGSAQTSQSMNPNYSNPWMTAAGLGAAGYGIYNYGKGQGWWGGSSGGSGGGTNQPFQTTVSGNNWSDWNP